MTPIMKIFAPDSITRALVKWSPAKRRVSDRKLKVSSYGSIFFPRAAHITTSHSHRSACCQRKTGGTEQSYTFKTKCFISFILVRIYIYSKIFDLTAGVYFYFYTSNIVYFPHISRVGSLLTRWDDPTRPVRFQKLMTRPFLIREISSHLLVQPSRFWQLPYKIRWSKSWPAKNLLVLTVPTTRGLFLVAWTARRPPTHTSSPHAQILHGVPSNSYGM